MDQHKSNKRQWFYSDYFLWGWYPASWQGWTVLTLCLVMLLGGSWLLLPHARLQPFDTNRVVWWLLFTLVCIGSLMLIVWKTGGRPQTNKK